MRPASVIDRIRSDKRPRSFTPDVRLSPKPLLRHSEDVEISPPDCVDLDVWRTLCRAFLKAQNAKWRNTRCGNNRLPTTEQLKLLKMLYEGRRMLAIIRATSHHKGTLGVLRNSLTDFLAQHPELPVPKCACGRKLWHRAVCPVWDKYHAGAIKKGHETQHRIAKLAASDGFFESQASARKLGQYARQKQGNAVRVEMLQLLESRPDLSRDEVLSRFDGRGFNRSSLSRILNTALEWPGFAMRGYVVKPPTVLKAEAADIFFQTINATKHMTIEPVLVNPQIQTFAALIQQGIDAWTEAGKLLVQMIEKDPNSKQEIMDSCPDITDEILARFEAIGRNQLHPKTLLNNSPGMRRLRRLPFSDQSRFIKENVPLLVRTETGTDILQVAVKNLTAQQALQVFATDCVRAPEAQRTWLESKKRKYTPRAPYQIKGHKIVFSADSEFTVRELADLVARMS
jgi:hypothetical protein